MSNEVSTNVFGGQVNIKDMQTMASKAKESSQNNPRAGGAPDGSDYLNFSGKQGRYKIGQDEREVQADEMWLLDVTSFQEGHVCWKGGQPASARMANIYNEPPVAQPDPEELGPFNRDKGDGWFQAKAMVLKSLDNEQQGYFRINSTSGVSAMAELIGEFSDRAAQGLPCWPVVCLDKEQFEAQGFKNFKPVFDVQGWIKTEQIEALVEGADIEDLMDEAENSDATEQVEDKTEEAPKASSKPKGRRRARG